jgi:glycosyltransferase involved in cell wall biosynthesis
MAVSVIIPLYNKAGTIERALASVFRQETEVDIIVIDDGSIDQSAAVVNRFGGSVRYFKQENSGPSAARNAGARLSRFPILAFLDADDEFLPGCLEAHIACRNAQSHVGVTISPHRSLQNTIIKHPETFIETKGFHYLNRFVHDAVSGIPISAVCVNRETFEAANGFDPRLRCWEVTDFMYRVLLASPKVGFLEKKYVSIHKHPTNSQFLKARADVTFRARSIHKLIDLLEALPPDQREIVCRQAAQTAKEFLVTGASKEAREILQRLHAKAGRRSGDITLHGLTLLPGTAVKLALAFRRRIWGTKDRNFRLPPPKTSGNAA